MSKIKTAKLSDKIVPAKGGPGAARTPRAGGGGGQAGGLSKTQINTVSTMQRVMGDLAKELGTPTGAEKAAQKFNEQYKKNVDPNELVQAARTWGATSAGGTTGSYDGIWGPNTKKSLENVRAFLAKIEAPGILIQPGNGDRPYKEMDEKAVLKIAEDNIANLVRIFEAFGLSAPVEARRRGDFGKIFDMVPRTLSGDAATSPDVWPTHWAGEDGLAVTLGDLRTLNRFFMFIQGLRLDGEICTPLAESDRSKEKPAPTPAAARKGEEPIDVGYADDMQMLANEILSRAIWKEGQTPAPAAARTAPAEEKKPESVSTGDHCFYEIDKIFSWFIHRTTAIRSILNRLVSDPRGVRPHPVYTQSAITKEHMNNAEIYSARIAALFEQWNRIKRSVLKALQNNPQNPVVTYEVLMNARGGGLLPAAARGGQPGGRGRAGESMTLSGDEEETIEDRIAQRGPFNNTWINMSKLDFLMPNTSNDLAALSRGGRLPDVSERGLRGNWTNLANTYPAGNTEPERMRTFPVWARTLRQAFVEIYNRWRDDNPNVTDDVASRQQKYLDRWTSRIDRALNMARRSGRLPRV